MFETPRGRAWLSFIYSSSCVETNPLTTTSVGLPMGRKVNMTRPSYALHKCWSKPLLVKVGPYNDWARYNSVYKVLNYYIKEPPFTNQLYHSERTSRLERRLKALEAGLTPEVLNDAAGILEVGVREDPALYLAELPRESRRDCNVNRQRQIESGLVRFPQKVS